MPVNLHALRSTLFSIVAVHTTVDNLKVLVGVYFGAIVSKFLVGGLDRAGPLSIADSLDLGVGVTAVVTVRSLSRAKVFFRPWLEREYFGETVCKNKKWLKKAFGVSGDEKPAPEVAILFPHLAKNKCFRFSLESFLLAATTDIASSFLFWTLAETELTRVVRSSPKGIWLGRHRHIEYSSSCCLHSIHFCLRKWWIVTRAVTSHFMNFQKKQQALSW